MAVAPGTRLGPYELIAPLGAGGMGEVYRAVDTRLDRSVAVKILPAEFAQNVNLKLRFEREAKTISQLNHPNICTLFDVGHQNGTDFLVMELIEGETLADRIGRGPMPLHEVLRYGVEIAEALDKAHKHGVVHRDLKPGNVMLTRGGAKLLDFGLARGGAIEVSADGETVQMQKSLTQEGTIVGTFQYMSPEQLEGVGVDHRTDIFALGALLYEMATGRRAFDGKTKTSLIAAIVSAQPLPISQLQPLTPPALEHVIERCLAKDPADRWQSAHDIAEELRWISAKGSQAGVTAVPAMRRKTRERLAWSLAALALVAALALGAFVITRPAPQRIVTSLNAPDGTSFMFDFTPAVISPDGKSVAFTAAGPDNRMALWVRPLSSPAALPLPGTDGAAYPFWSPDSKHIGFFADGKLKRTEARGGAVDRIADAVAGRGGTWGRGDVIVFTPAVGEVLFRVSASGEDLRPITSFGTPTETSHRFPSFLPDGVHFAYFVQGPSGEEPNIYVGSVNGGEARKLMRADTGVVCTKAGDVLYVRGGVLRARRLDPQSLVFEGEPVTISERTQSNFAIGVMNASASDTGILTYTTGGVEMTSRLVWMGLDGKELKALPAGDVEDPQFSPDGKRLAYSLGNPTNLYLHDIARNTTSRFTFGAANEWAPVWSPDGQWIAYTSFVTSSGDIHVKRANGTEPDRKLIAGKRRKTVSDWPAKDVLMYHVAERASGWDIETYSFAEGRSRSFLKTPFNEWGARVSSNGKWCAYVSDETGTPQIYVRSFEAPDTAGKWQVSVGGGTMPAWSPDGKQIYYFSNDHKLMAANVTGDGDSFAVDVARPILSARLRGFAGLTRNQYDTHDGRTFVLNAMRSEDAPAEAVTIVQNWRAR